MATNNLQSYIAQVAGPSTSDLAPLLANETFRRAVDAELAARDASATAAAAVVARGEDLYTGVQPFAAAMGSLRAVAKRFPETSKLIGEAVTLVQQAMGIVAYNPPPLTPVPPAPTPTPTPVAVAPKPVPPPTPAPAAVPAVLPPYPPTPYPMTPSTPLSTPAPTPAPTPSTPPHV